MPQEIISELAKIEVPFGKEINFQDIKHESGLQMMRIRIKEGSRFTILDIDHETAKKWGIIFDTWIKETKLTKPP